MPALPAGASIVRGETDEEKAAEARFLNWAGEVVGVLNLSIDQWKLAQADCKARMLPPDG